MFKFGTTPRKGKQRNITESLKLFFTSGGTGKIPINPKTSSPETMPERHDYAASQVHHLLGDKFRFEEFLGKGGFASVYRVTNLALGRAEALKILLDHDGHHPDFSERFTQEARVSASLDHPHIVQVYEFGQVENHSWFTMQYIEGPTLAAEMNSRGAMDEGTAVRLVMPLLDALEYSHKRGVIHRDIKPTNIILDLCGRPHLMDFGIAKSLGSMLKTQTGHLLGTPVYISPEQALAKDIDSRADIYGLGVTLYQMLTGKFPFPAEDAVQAVVLRLTLKPTPLSVARPGISPELEAIVMRALEKERDKRFATAGEMQRALLDFLGEKHLGPPMEITSWSRDMPQETPTIPFHDSAGIPTLKVPGPAMAEKKRNTPRIFLSVLLVISIAFTVWALFVNRNDGHMVMESKATTGGKKSPPVSKTSPGKKAAVVPSAEKMTRQPKQLPEQPPSKKETAGKFPQNQTQPVSKKTVLLPGRPVKPPRILKEVPPVFNAAAAENCPGQVVNLSLTISGQGRVSGLKVISSGHPPECAEAIKAVTAAVRQYTFQPALDAEGNPVEGKLALAIQL